MFRLFAFAFAVVAWASPFASADVVFVVHSYRTGPYANNGVPYMDGFADYMTLLNERDGGIEGERIVVQECEYGYNTDKGVECYENNREAGSLAYLPLSTGVTYRLIPMTQKDDVPLVTVGYGRTAAADGDVFRHVFNFPAHYWQGAAAQIRYIKEAVGDMQGLKIGLVHHNSAYGKEPIPTLQALARREGYELILYPVDHPGAEQGGTWDEIDRDRPDWLLLWGWGVMNPTALKSAVDREFPIDRLIGVWWSSNETDIIPLGKKARGYKAITFHEVGTDFTVYNQLNDVVYFADKAAGFANNLGTTLYNRGIFTASMMAEAARTAMEIHGTTDITPGMMRDGLEALNVSDEFLNRTGLEGFVPPFAISCANHVGNGLVAITEWDDQLRGWRRITDYYEPDGALIDPLVRSAANAYAQENGIRRGRCR